jgi:hypothetical protein
LLFSLLNVPNPKRFRSEDVFELKDPVFTERARDSEVMEPELGVDSPARGCPSNSASISLMNRSSSEI